MLIKDLRILTQSPAFHEKLAHIYACAPNHAQRYANRICAIAEAFEQRYGTGRELAVFSAPGRTEVGGNHTDHQRGRVLAASVNLDVVAVVAVNGDGTVRVKSEGHPGDVLQVGDTAPVPAEKNSSASLIRGICAAFKGLGYPVGGFDAYTSSSVLAGSGLSSSAAFETLIGTMVNCLFCAGRESAVKIAQIGQYAENVYFGKPSGLMDQAASSVGGFISIDFADKEHPVVERVNFDFAECGYALCIIDTKGSHSDLTSDYAAVPREMCSVAACFGKEVLGEVPEEEFYAALPTLRGRADDRAILRAMHFYGDNARVPKEAAALRAGDFTTFKRLIIESGQSSFMYLQNVFSPSHIDRQSVSITLALCQRLLAPVGGAWRVHGGGFAGTVQAFVPATELSRFTAAMEAVLGQGACHILSVRPVGGIRIV